MSQLVHKETEGFRAAARALRSVARLGATAGADHTLRESVRPFGSPEFRHLVEDAEEHGLAPLLRRHLKAAQISVDTTATHQLTALAVRHREASRVHTAVLVEIDAALATQGIEVVFLKGAVLAHELYPSPELRPRRDIDILVSPEQAVAALTTLRELGFEGFDPGRMPRGGHHHLPGVSAVREGFAVAVEVHTDALSHDQPQRMRLASVRAALRRVSIGGREVAALGVDDMMRHLAAHLLEPARETRLINVVDLVEWAAQHAAAIDWARLERESRRTVVTLQLMHYLTGLPEPLAWARPTVPAPPGVGQNIPMLSSLDWSPRRLPTTLGALLFPSPWWMHGFYGVPPGTSLETTRWTRHAPRMAAWALRRMRMGD